MEMNKWLKELGLTWYDLPGNYIPKTSWKIRLRRRWYRIKRSICFAFAPLEEHAPDYREEYEYEAYDKRNKIDNRGFCEYEFFSLDYSMALYIYPRLCEFREKYAKYGTPSYFIYDEEGNEKEGDAGHEEWLATLDKMILSFKYILKEPETEEWKNLSYKEQDEIIQEGLHLFAEHYRALWW